MILSGNFTAIYLKIEICSNVLVSGTEIPVSPIRQFELINDIATRWKIDFVKLPYCLTLDIVYLHLFNGVAALVDLNHLHV